MSHLRELQQGFQNYLLHDQAGFEQHIIGTAEALSEHRLAVYFNAYRGRLIDCLATDFRGLQNLLGEYEFENLALAYLQQYPSKNPSVRWIGQHLAEFLQQSEPWKQQPWLAEIAAFEWAQSLVFCGPEPQQAPLTLEALQQVQPEQWGDLRFGFIDNLQTLDLYWNAVPIWMQLEQQQQSDTPQASDYPVRWVLWRQQHDPYWRSLEAHESWALEQAQLGANFAELCEGLGEWIDAEQTPMVAAGLLQQWLGDQWLVSISVD